MVLITLFHHLARKTAIHYITATSFAKVRCFSGAYTLNLHQTLDVPHFQAFFIIKQSGRTSHDEAKVCSRCPRKLLPSQLHTCLSVGLGFCSKLALLSSPLCKTSSIGTQMNQAQLTLLPHSAFPQSNPPKMMTLSEQKLYRQHHHPSTNNHSHQPTHILQPRIAAASLTRQSKSNYEEPAPSYCATSNPLDMTSKIRA